MAPNRRSRAVDRLSRGGAALTRRTAQWAATHRAAAACATLAGAPALLGAAHRDPRLMAYTAAAITWAAWRAGHSPHPTPTDTPTATTSDDSGQKGSQGGGGAGMSIIKTVNGTATTHPHPTQPNRTEIRWDKT